MLLAGYNHPETIATSNNRQATINWPYVAGEYHRNPKKGEGLTYEGRPTWTQQTSEGGNFLYYSKNKIWLVGLDLAGDASRKFHSSWQGLMLIPKSNWGRWAMSEKALRPHASKWILDQKLEIEGEQKR